MVNEDFHKGQRCIFSAVMCQEGFCSGCMIFLNRVTELEQSVGMEERRLEDNCQEKGEQLIIHW